LNGNYLLRGADLKKGFILPACAILFLWAAPAHAEWSKQTADKVSGLIDKAVAEFTVFLNCSATNPADHAQIKKSWHKDAHATLLLLEQAGTGKRYRRDFAIKANYRKLMRPNMKFGEILKMCRANANWRMKIATLDYTLLPRDVRRALKAAK
jgi:hypothetical protein